MHRHRGQDIRQLAFTVPSLNIESSNGRTFPRFYIRGYGNTDFNSFASQPVSLVYDDIVQENPALKGFPMFDQADVEVLRGPQGTLFGRNSPAGVVKLESAKPVLGQFSGSASVSDGTYNTADFDGVVNVPINDTMAFRASTQGQHRDNWVNAPHPTGDQTWKATTIGRPGCSCSTSPAITSAPCSTCMAACWMAPRACSAPTSSNRAATSSCRASILRDLCRRLQRPVLHAASAPTPI